MQLVFLEVQFFFFFLIKFSSRIRCHPNVAELTDNSAFGSLQFIDKMVELIGAFDKLGFVTIDTQLNFDEDLLPIHQVDKNVPCLSFEFVFYFNNLQNVWMVEVDSFYFLVKGNDFSLFGCELAPQ